MTVTIDDIMYFGNILRPRLRSLRSIRIRDEGDTNRRVTCARDCQAPAFAAGARKAGRLGIARVRDPLSGPIPSGFPPGLIGAMIGHDPAARP